MDAWHRRWLLGCFILLPRSRSSKAPRCGLFRLTSLHSFCFAVGRIVFQLFSDICPKTSKNFLCLCTGEKGAGKITGKKLCYKGSTFHRVVKNFMIQGGDFTEGDDDTVLTGLCCSHNVPPPYENLTLKHDRAFLLSMANRGKDTNGSQFFIVHVVFGLVISGFEVIKKIEGLKTDSASRPYADVRVVDCGQLIVKSANDGQSNLLMT
uniref:Peptidyl-prolyl cis-trans isomerase n=1 Tax=Hippocampus comes TaxID=109280 RepID=A0A3Q2Z1E5_HIPCM